ncbi:hypothetical protein ACFVXE_35480 [Streptomyces sp. NPDC058231]|uniref:hypothetical protein n=1 Tax=Streptomyces sp. NPDC058231 TaxID=3346392 RepID=UPI0036F0CD82
MTSGGSRRPVVPRRAKSDWSDDMSDDERSLTTHGCRNAPAASRWLREAGCVPDLVVSDA